LENQGRDYPTDTGQRDQPDQGNQTTTPNGQRGIQREERVRLGGVRTREDPTRPKEPDPHSQQTERGEGLGWTGEKNQIVVGMNP